MPPKGPVQKLPLGRGFDLECSFPSAHAVETALCLRGRRIWGHTFSEATPSRRHRIRFGLARATVHVESDMFGGDVTWRFHLERRGRRRTWRTVVDTGPRTVLHFDPAVGEVDGRTDSIAPEMLDTRFGKCQTCTPSILRIHVDGQTRHLCEVGSVVKDVMFRDYPPFVFNTVACVGAFPPGSHGQYPDPSSIWFNTFVGYYQLDCAKPAWTRPFGYESASGLASVPAPEDLTRLGKSDWNWFSNWDYGVPRDVLIPLSTVDMTAIGYNLRGPVRIGSTQWHELELEDVEVASCYVADTPGRQLVQNTILDEVWKKSFGTPVSRPTFPTSFVPTRVNALVDMAYWEDEAAYHTVIFGGTARVGTDPDFLTAQVDATKKVIERFYPDRGF